jgi:hypothetical protein
MMRWLSLGCVLVLVFDGAAAPIRQPHDRPDEADPLKVIALDQFPKDGIAAFGNWVIGHTPQEHGILVIHRHSRIGIYLPWAANSWINYRSVDGTSHILYPFPRTDSGQMQRDYDINRLLGKAPQTRIGPGNYKFQTWTVNVSHDRIDFNCSSMNGCRVTVRSDGSTFLFNDRVIGGQK